MSRDSSTSASPLSASGSPLRAPPPLVRPTTMEIAKSHMSSMSRVTPRGHVPTHIDEDDDDGGEGVDKVLPMSLPLPSFNIDAGPSPNYRGGMGKTQVQQIQHAFLKFKPNEEEMTITKDNVVSFLRGVGLNPSSSHIQALFERIGAHGEIHFYQFAEMIRQQEEEKIDSELSDLLRAFDLLDLSGTGVVNARLLLHRLETLKLPPEQKHKARRDMQDFLDFCACNAQGQFEYRNVMKKLRANKNQVES